MALTSIIIPTAEGSKHLQVETIPGDNGVIVHWYGCDENFQHIGEADASADKRSEEEFHVELRKAAAEKGQYITSHSTNPEWNPEDYTKVHSTTEDDGSNSESDRAEGE
jgi:hypothetical protein